LIERLFDMSQNTSSIVSTNRPTGVGITDPAFEAQQLVDQLADLWRTHQKRGLEVRWETGTLLNCRLGLPTERQTHGQQVLKRVAEGLQIAESDLYRMRWFAFLFRSVEDCQAKYPEARSWTKVKELLPNLMAARKGSGEKLLRNEAEKEDAAVIDGILRSLSTVTERFRQSDFHLEESKRKQMRKAIQQLMEVVAEPLQIRVRIESDEAA
jgi:hypothetical protein